jgi:hypothetical protein
MFNYKKANRNVLDISLAGDKHNFVNLYEIIALSFMFSICNYKAKALFPATNMVISIFN